MTTAIATPVVRGRLRSRLPGKIRTARGLIQATSAWILFLPATVAILIAGGFAAKNNLDTRTLTIVAVVWLIIGLLGIVAAQMIRGRMVAGYWLAVLFGLVNLGFGAWVIYQVIVGRSGTQGNGAFLVVIAALVYVVLGGGIVYNLLGEVRWSRGLGEERRRTTGRQMVEPIREMSVERSHPGTATPETPAPALAVAAPLPKAAVGEDTTGDAGTVVVEGTVAAAPADVAAPTNGAAAPAAAGEPLLVVQGLKKHFPIHGGILRRQIGTVYAVDGVDFSVARGEVFSLVGESGCGKTTLGRSVLQLTPPTAGSVIFDGYELGDVDPEDMRPLRRRMQIIFQDPFGSLNPRMPVSDIIGEGLYSQGVTNRAVRDRRVEDALEVVGLRREYTRRYPHEFSGGQRQRIGIARALALGPDLVVCDEPVSALDVSIQSQILNLLLDLRREFNLTYLFISHNLSVVQYFADRIGVMYLGRIVEQATVKSLYRQPRHPYSVALLSAIPQPDPRRRRKRLVLKGDVPSPAAPPSGCRFHTRCWLRERLGNPERCSTEEPLLRDVGDGHLTACHFAEEISEQTVSQVVAAQSTIETAVAEVAEPA
jgi:oligopeptide/dipeptide ABC transporter ATP-binding protein